MEQGRADDVVLRLIWPQWQGAGPSTVASLTPELPFPAAQLGYHLGSHLLQWLAPAATGPEHVVPVATFRDGLATTDGIFARDVLVQQLRAGLTIIEQVEPARIVTFGGECSVSVAPLSYLADRYGDDLAVIWIDSHPDTAMPQCRYDGYNAMAVSHLLGHGDPEVLELLPSRLQAANIALAGLHAWEDDEAEYLKAWGLRSFPPEPLQRSSEELLKWLGETGCSKVAIHFDVDSIDSHEMVFGLGMEPNGLSSHALIRLVSDIAASADVVGLTIAEYLPRQVIALREILHRLPLVGTPGG